MQNCVRIASTSLSDNDCEIGFRNLTRCEIDQFKQFALGQVYLKVNDTGRLESLPYYQTLPSPCEDKKMSPFWRPINLEGVQLELFEAYSAKRKDLKNHYPSIVIQHLCAYNYSEEFYKREAGALESYGFECLRSRRGNDGEFSEMWVLFDLIFAKGDLKALLEKYKDKNTEEKVCYVSNFLANHVSFGTLDVTVQRMAAVMD